MLDRFYPIVPDSAWLRTIVPFGVKTVQLRAKDMPPEQIAREIAGGLAICREYGCQLIVNDYWREAIDLGADYVHLGQEDLSDADLPAIRRPASVSEFRRTRMTNWISRLQRSRIMWRSDRSTKPHSRSCAMRRRASRG
jgi:hypothetical protein